MPQVKAYHRPATVDEAIRLLSRSGLRTVVLGGGTYLIAHLGDTVDEVVDLQALGLTQMSHSDNRLTLGAMVQLQTLVEDAQVPALLRETAHRAGPNTLRQAATIGGAVTGAHKESELIAALLVFEAEVHVQSSLGSKTVALPNFLLDIPAALEGGIVTAVSLIVTGKTAAARVARTPADSPIVAAIARLSGDGKLRLALCGVAATPVLVDPENVKAGINPQADFRGSREYRRQMAAVLAKRVIDEVRS
jgi:CO/xanthine dehydrogenase FAD-binding subunit